VGWRTDPDRPEDFISLGDTVAIPRHWQDVRWLALTIALSVAAAVGLGGVSGWNRLLHVVLHPLPTYFAVAFAAQAVALAAYAVAYRDVISMAGSVPAVEAMTLTVAGFGAHLPRGGFGFDYGFLRSRGQSHDDAKRTVLLLGLLEYAVLAPMTWVAAVELLLARSHVQRSLTLSWAIGVPAGTLITCWLVARHKRGKRVWKPLVNMLSGIELLASMLVRVRRWPALIGMACYWAADMVCLWAGLRAFGSDLGVAAIIVAFATGYALSRRTMPFAGAGLIELFLIFALTWVGTPLVRAIPAVFAYRVLNIWVPTVCGLVAVRARLRSGSRN
jgi:uncharacterized membrane protein YbhN (UPF0104 family)